MLYARKVPDEGGETRILDMKAAYDGLDEPTRERIDGLVAVHFYGSTSGRDGELPTPKLTDAQAANVPPVPHPLVRAPMPSPANVPSTRSAARPSTSRGCRAMTRTALNPDAQGALRAGQVHLRAQVRGR